MIFDRRRFYIFGILFGLGLAAFIWFSPKQTPEQLVASDLAVLAREPWHLIYVTSLEVRGPIGSPSEVFVHGQRPNGTKVLVQFIEDSPYTSATAMRRLAQQAPTNKMTEMVIVPRSMVRSEFVDGFATRATHVGVALFVPIPPDAENFSAEQEGTDVMSASMGR